MANIPDCNTLLLQCVGSRLNPSFNRPERRNAINTEVIIEFDAVLTGIFAPVAILKNVGRWMHLQKISIPTPFLNAMRV